jgi:hypothetical protein
MEIISNLNILIVAYNKLKSNLGNIMGMGPMGAVVLHGLLFH